MRIISSWVTINWTKNSSKKCFFYLSGGPLNVRGFDTRGIGPSSEGSSLGGSLFWSSGLHLYAPLPFRPEMRGFADNFKTHMFLTAGNLGNFRLSGDMGRNLEHVTQDFRLSYGLGLAVKLGGVARIELNYCVPVKVLSSSGSSLTSNFKRQERTLR